MRWFAYLSNGEVVAEVDEPGEESTWRQLMRRCQRDGLWLRNLVLVVNGRPHSCLPDAEGYWQAYLGFAVLTCSGGGETPGEPPPMALQAKGIGWVQNGVLHTIWAELNGSLKFDPPRRVEGEKQIIWHPAFRSQHGGANERLIIQDGRALRESDGAPVRQPEPAIVLPRMGLVIGETD